MATASVDFFQVAGTKPVTPGQATSAPSGASGAVEAFEQIVASLGGQAGIVPDGAVVAGAELSSVTAQSAKLLAPRPMVSADVEKAMTAGLLVDAAPVDGVPVDGILPPMTGSDVPAVPVEIEDVASEADDGAPDGIASTDGDGLEGDGDPTLLLAAAVPVPVVPVPVVISPKPATATGEGIEPITATPSAPVAAPELPVVPQPAGTIVPVDGEPVEPLIEGRAATAAPAPDQPVSKDQSGLVPAKDVAASAPQPQGNPAPAPAVTSVPIADADATEPSIVPVAGPVASAAPVQTRPAANVAASSTPAPADAAAIANAAGVTSVKGTTTPTANDQSAAPTTGAADEIVTATDAKPVAPVIAAPVAAKPVETVEMTATTAKAQAEAVAAIAPETPKPEAKDAKPVPSPAPQPVDAKAETDRPADVKSADQPQQTAKSEKPDDSQDKPVAQANDKPVSHADKNQTVQQMTDAKPTVVDAVARLNAQTQAQAAVAIPALAGEIASRVKKGSSRFEIRLDPQELGRVDVRVDIDKNGTVHSRLIVEKAETLELLKSDQRALERALTDAGFKTDQGSLSFSMRDDRGAQQQFQQQRALWESATQSPITEEEPARLAAETAYRAPPRADGGLDLRV
ncbi:flagellar hook-length control protein FliK [Flaviflagellibacter deserti]|uniref:Flagellar hook-length control protein FliK n=1 Tax=Flaviflagellibacter deserti TaxID=2267266 RepID=A0ABV9YYN8_9HYPH